MRRAIAGALVLLGAAVFAVSTPASAQEEDPFAGAADVGQDEGEVCTGFAAQTDGTGLQLALGDFSLTAGLSEAFATTLPEPPDGPRATARGEGSALTPSVVESSAGEGGAAPDADDPPAASGPLALPPAVPVADLVTATGDADTAVDADGNPSAFASGEVSTIALETTDLIAALPTDSIDLPDPLPDLSQLDLLLAVLGIGEGSTATVQLGVVTSDITSDATGATATSQTVASSIDLLEGILGPLVSITVASPSATVDIAADGSTGSAAFTNPVLTAEVRPVTATVVNGIVDAVVAGLPQAVADLLRPTVTGIITPLVNSLVTSINAGLAGLGQSVEAGEAIDVDVIPGLLSLRLAVVEGGATGDGVVPASAFSGVVDLLITLAGQEITLIGGAATADADAAGCLVPPVEPPPVEPPPVEPPPVEPPPVEPPPVDPPPVNPPVDPPVAPPAVNPPTIAPPAPDAPQGPLPRTGDDRPLHITLGLTAALLAAGALVLSRRVRATA